MLTLAYSCFSNEQYIYYNLKHHYDYADKIIVSYGNFTDFPKYREMMGLPAEDNTLEIVKDFIANEDVDNKIQLIIQKDGFKNFTDSRNSWLRHVDTEWVCSLDCDEFYFTQNMIKAKELMVNYVDKDVNMIQCDRRSFSFDYFHYYANSWNTRIFSHEDPQIGIFADEMTNTKRQSASVIAFKNGVAVVPQNGHDLFSVVAYRNKSGMKWTENGIDSILVDGDNNPYFSDCMKMVYEPCIRYNHYYSCDDPRDFFARSLYYSAVNGASEDEIKVKAEQNKIAIEKDPYCQVCWFENDPGIYFKEYNGEHPFDLGFDFKHDIKADEIVDLEIEERKKHAMGLL